MEYLTLQNRQRCEGDAIAPDADFITAAGKHVIVILGGGDTGADCLSTAHRQGARSVALSPSDRVAAGPPDARAE